MAQWFLQKQIDEISAEIRALRASVYNVDGAIDESNPLAVKAKALETKLDDLQLLLQSGDQKVQLSGHIQEFAVASWDDLPPDSVPVGSVAMLIGTNDIRQTDGEEWLPI